MSCGISVRSAKSATMKTVRALLSRRERTGQRASRGAASKHGTCRLIEFLCDLIDVSMSLFTPTDSGCCDREPHGTPDSKQAHTTGVVKYDIMCDDEDKRTFGHAYGQSAVL